VTGPHPRRSWPAPLRHAAAALLAPAALLTTGLFGGGMLMMLVYSFYTFQDGLLLERFSARAWGAFFLDPFYWDVMGRSAWLGATVTFWALLLGYPAAYALARIRSPRILVPAYVCIFSPLLVSVVVRAYGWLLLLSEQGIVNWVLLRLGVVSEPVRMIYNATGVTVSLVHIMLPYMIFPLVSVLRQIDPALKEAAADLGAGRVRTFLEVVLPLSLGGVVAGCQIVFTLAISAFTAPALLGGGRVMVLSRLVFDNVASLNWPLGAVQAFALLGMALLVVFLFTRLGRPLDWQAGR
jgi:putative spermidine/putrescine transport system permease protein